MRVCSALLAFWSVAAAAQAPVLEHRFTPDVPEPLAFFGFALDLDGDRALVGAFDNRGLSDGGVAYVYERAGTEWSETARLVPADRASGDDVGFSVALDGDRALVGAINDDDDGQTSGSATLFESDGAGWAEAATLTGAGAEAFGWSVALDGDRALVGAIEVAFQGGGAFVFERGPDGWAQTALLLSDDFSDQRLGSAVALDGDRLVVTSLSRTGGLPGRVHVFESDGTDWVRTQIIAAPSPQASSFGHAVALDGDRLVVGAYGADGGAGAAYVYDALDGAWSLTDRLAAPGADGFGWSVALRGSRAAVGATGSDSAHLFALEDGAWMETDRIEAGAPGGWYGSDVALGDGRLLVGASGEAVGPVDSGAAYAYALPAQVAAEAPLEAALALTPAGPNPASSPSSAALTVQRPGPVRVTAYDALGRAVAVLFQGSVAPGGGVQIPLPRLAPGAYVLRATGPAGDAALRVTVAR